MTCCGTRPCVRRRSPSSADAVADRWRFRFDRAARPLRVLGVSPATCWVELGTHDLEARFGPWRCRTPLDNVRDVRTTWDYTAVKAIGPRGSFADLGATFGTSTVGGVCICFHERVAALTPVPVHPALTVTVEDVEGLATALRARCGLVP